MALAGAVHRPLRVALACLLLLGAALAGFTAPLAAWRVSVVSGLVFVAVAACLVVLAVATLRRARWALLISLVGCGGQLLGVVGTAWELAHPLDTAKTRELLALGVDPTLAVTINLIYSAAASTLFVWAAAPLVTTRRRCAPGLLDTGADAGQDA